MPHRFFTAVQARQNRLFLDALARTGNARLAAQLLGVHRATYTRRRAKCPAFAARWDAALAAFQAKPILPGTGRGTACNAVEGAQGLAPATRPKTLGGEPTLTRLANGRVQLRLAQPGRMTRAAEQAFLRALSASANVRLAAAAAGFAHSSFYARARKCPGFAREMRLALAEGYGRLEQALLAGFRPDSHEHDDWRRNDPPPIPSMTAAQALQLLYLHEKSVRQSWERPHRRKRRGEPWDTYTQRLAAMWCSEKAREAEDDALRQALSREPDEFLPGTGRGTAEGGGGGPEPEPIDIALDQVTGWSKADPTKPPHDPDRALFGGWRLEMWEKREQSKHGR